MRCIITTLILVAALSGCTLLSPSQELRITEYSGTYMTASGTGCRIVGEMEPKGCIRVKTEHCSYTSSDCRGN